MATGADHYREAERLLAAAHAEYMDDSDDAAPRREYANDDAWYKALEIAREMREQKAGTAALLTSIAQAHATLAAAAATALLGTVAASGYDDADLDAWREAAKQSSPSQGSGEPS